MHLNRHFSLQNVKVESLFYSVVALQFIGYETKNKYFFKLENGNDNDSDENDKLTTL